MATPGKVYLVGAGPGDPGLITVKGLTCLRQGDVVVYDRLIDRRLLGEAKPDAELIYVGKLAEAHTVPQAEINELLVRRAGEGKTVVRLKGGDPFVFGRGAEEAEALVAAGLSFEVVPGVTSAVAVPAYAGIPVTHRRLAASLAIVAGHEDPTKPESKVDWDALSRTSTIVFLMGVKNLPQIVGELLRRGRAPETPAALINWGTFPRQRALVGTLGDIVERVNAAGFRPPAVTVVGDVVSLREKLRWFDNRPLFGKRVLVTRSREQASALAVLLEEQGATPVELPAVAMRPLADYGALDAALARLDRYDWAIFTSVNGVAYFFARLLASGRDVRELKGVRLGAIGPATAKALADRGLRVDFVPEEYVAESVVAGLKGLGVAGARIILPRALEAREVIVRDLAAAGATIDEIPVYETIRPAEQEERARQIFAGGEVDIATFTSSSTVRNFLALLGGDAAALREVTVACIGPITADTARELGLRVDVVAAEHTIPGLVRAIVEFEKERTP